MAVLRYPMVKQQLFGVAPLSPEEAFTRTSAARLGYHNDCFLASNTSGNTYASPTPNGTTPAYIEALKTYVSQESRFVPQEGETCSVAASAQPYIQCPNALKDLERERWSTLDVDYHREVIELWRQQGCFDEIQRRLGYRFRLVTASIPAVATAGGTLSLTFTITNDGWAAPFNPRAAMVVFRHTQTGRVFTMDIGQDPRRWGAGETHTVPVTGTVPTDAEAGDYQVLLNFPDPEPTLYNRPEYAIRLANDGLWEASSGSNALPVRITIAR